MRATWRRLALLLLLAMPPDGRAAEALRLGYAVGPDRATVGLVLRRWAQGLTLRPESGLEVRVAPAPAATEELRSGLVDGTVDVAWLPLDQLAAAPHPLQLLELPLRGRPGEVIGRAAAGLLASEQWHEVGPFTLLLAVGEAPLWLHGRSGIADGELAGLRVLAPTRPMQAWVERLGAVATGSGADADAILLSWGGLALEPDAALTDHLQLGAPPERAAALAPALATRLGALAMRRDRLGALPDAARQALRDSVDAEVAAVAGRGFDQVDRLARERARGGGQTLYRVDPARAPAWRAAARAVEEGLMDALTAQGLDAAALWRAAQVAVARASAVRSDEVRSRVPPRHLAGG